MVNKDLIGKCGIYKEYPEEYKGKIYYEYFHNNGIIEGTLKKYMKTWMDDSNSEFRLCSEVNYINGKRNGIRINFNLFDEPSISLAYNDDNLIYLKSFYRDRNGNNDYFKFFFNDMMPTKLEMNDISFDLNFINHLVNVEFDKEHFQIFFKDDSLQFYWNERGGVFDMSELF